MFGPGHHFLAAEIRLDPDGFVLHTDVEFFVQCGTQSFGGGSGSGGGDSVQDASGPLGRGGIGQFHGSLKLDPVGIVFWGENPDIYRAFEGREQFGVRGLGHGTRIIDPD